MAPGVERVGAWLKSPARALHIYLTAAAIGLIAFLLVYGVGHLLGTTAYWQMPEQDERMALMGYRYFLADSWHWPVFLNDAVNVPYAKSVAFLDCIPIWALVNKGIATIIPPWKSFSADAYLGMWHALAYALQACFGVVCLRALGHRSWRANLATALFFIAIPTWIFRYPHAALSAHWVLLAAFYLYLRTPTRERTSLRLGIAKVSQLALAALVTPYLAVMSLPVFAASVLRSRDRRTIATWLPLGVIAILLANWFAGYFAPETATPQWGFDQESANLLGWLIPQRSGIIGDAQWIASANGTPWQYEGYAYLGIGALGLFALFVPHLKSLRGVVGRHAPLFIVAVAAALFALSNHIYFGSHHIVSYRIPRLLQWIPDQFRSPGRFVWIPTYVLLIFLMHSAFTRFASWRRFAIIAVLVVLQVVDATGDWRLQHMKTRAAHGAIIDREGWRPLVHAHSAVTILPPYPCVFADADGVTLDQASREIHFVASERALPINGTYSAREMRKCEAEEAEWGTLALQPNMLYVLLPQALAVADRFEATGGHCGASEFGRVCSTNASAIDDALRAKILRATPGPIVIRDDQTLDFTTTSTDAGWSAVENGGRWTTTSIASVLLRVEGEPPPNPVLTVQLQALLCGSREAQDVDVLIDEQVLATLHFDKSTNAPGAVRTIPISSRDRLRRPFALQFRPRDIRSPEKLKCSEDTRRIGVGLSRVTVGTGHVSLP